MVLPAESASPDTLLSHGRFVRALARSLLRDEHAAEDVAQETWLRYLERPPRSALDPRGWLAAVVRNLASNARRDRDRRADRELDLGAANPRSSADEGVLQADVLRSVVDAVLALDEPYRSTVLARYFRGSEPQEIVRETGVPLATVKSRLQRALAMLRERLDREHGERRAWGLALASLADLGRAAGSTAIWKMAGAALLLGVPTLVVWKALETRSPTASDVEPPVQAAASLAESPESTVESVAPAAGRSVAAATSTAGTIRVAGTLRNLPYPELGIPGGPAAAVELFVAMPRKGSSPPKMDRFVATTRDDGSFELEIPRPEPGGFPYALSAKMDDVWRSVHHPLELAPDTRAADTPEHEGLQLSRAAHGIFRGRVVDAGEKPVPGVELRLRAPRGKESEVRTFASDDQGSFEVVCTSADTRVEPLDGATTVLAFDRPVAREAGGWEPGRIVLASSATLRVRVVGRSGAGVPGLSVRAELASGERRAQGIAESWFGNSGAKHGKTDARGEIELGGIWAGHHIELSVENHVTASQRAEELLYDAERGAGEPIVLVPGEARTVVVRWTGELRVAGRTLTPEGRPVPDVGVEVTDLGTDRGGRREQLGVVRSGPDGSFEGRFLSRSLRGPVRVVAREKGSTRSGLAQLGYAGVLRPTEGALGIRTLELAEAVDGVLQADVVIEPGLSISGRLLDARGELVKSAGMGSSRFWAAPAGSSLFEAQRAQDEIGFQMDDSGVFTLFGLRKGDYDLFVSEEIASFYTWSTFLHRFPGIPAGSQGIELRLPKREEVRVRIRIHGEEVEGALVLHGRLAPRDADMAKVAAANEARIAGVEGWPVGATLDFAGVSGDETEEGSWSYGFYGIEDVAEHELQPMESGWYVFGVHSYARKGARSWFPQATEPRWYEPGEYTIDFDVVPTTTIEGRILADATREHLGIELVTERGARVPLEAKVGSGEPAYVLETDAAGRFVIRHAPVGKFLLRAGNVAELERGRFRSEVSLEVGAGGVSGLEVRF